MRCNTLFGIRGIVTGAAVINFLLILLLKAEILNQIFSHENDLFKVCNTQMIDNLPSHISVNGDPNPFWYSAYVRLKSKDPSCRWRTTFNEMTKWYMTKDRETKTTFQNEKVNKLTYIYAALPPCFTISRKRNDNTCDEVEFSFISGLHLFVETVKLLWVFLFLFHSCFDQWDSRGFLQVCSHVAECVSDETHFQKSDGKSTVIMFILTSYPYMSSYQVYEFELL